MRNIAIIVFSIFAFTFSCINSNTSNKDESVIKKPELPAPYATPSVIKESIAIGWPFGKTPVAPDGFIVSLYIDGLASPRWIYETPGGDILVACSETDSKKSANKIILLRDSDNDGAPEIQSNFLTGLNQPLGMVVYDDWFYVANTDGIWRYPYVPGQLKILKKGQKILDLPAGGYNNHWTRNIILNADKTKMYVSVGSGSNNGENGMDKEKRRAAILELNLDGTNVRIYADGIRNPVGMAWQPGTDILWTTVNERDELGDDLVPDYLTSVQNGGFYGWPYAYFGNNEDPRMKGQRQDLVKKTIIPDVDLGAHTASLGLSFYTSDQFPAEYLNGAFIGQHGSWNRSDFAGYKVVYVPFENGKPQKPEDFLTGFISSEEKKEVFGRPAGVFVTSRGSLLVADDAGNTIWKVVSAKQ